MLLNMKGRVQAVNIKIIETEGLISLGIPEGCFRNSIILNIHKRDVLANFMVAWLISFADNTAICYEGNETDVIDTIVKDQAQITDYGTSLNSTIPATVHLQLNLWGNERRNSESKIQTTRRTHLFLMFWLEEIQQYGLLHLH